jgi:glycerol uptake facilitator protein
VVASQRAGTRARPRRRAARDTADVAAAKRAGGDLGRRLAAEAIGTGILVLFGAGSVVAALRLGGGRLDYAGLGMIGLAFAIAIAVAIYAFGTTSGAHINPAVTIALAARGRFPTSEVGPYIGAQLLGGVLGAILILAIFGGGAADINGTGGTHVADGVSYLRAIVVEAVGTFLLVIAIFALAVDTRAPAGWAGFMIGLAVACAILLIGPVTGASLNPSRTFGPLLVTTLWGGATDWGDIGVYIIGPILGAVLAGIAYDLVTAPRGAEPQERAEPAQGTAGDITGRREPRR